MQHYDVDRHPLRLKGGTPPNLLESVELKKKNNKKKAVREYEGDVGENLNFSSLKITVTNVYILNANQTMKNYC